MTSAVVSSRASWQIMLVNICWASLFNRFHYGGERSQLQDEFWVMWIIQDMINEMNEPQKQLQPSVFP